MIALIFLCLNPSGDVPPVITENSIISSSGEGSFTEVKPLQGKSNETPKNNTPNEVPRQNISPVPSSRSGYERQNQRPVYTPPPPPVRIPFLWRLFRFR